MNGKRKLPKGWRWEKIEDHISDYQSGLARGEKSMQEGYPHLRMNNISNNLKLDLTLLWHIPANEGEVKSYCLQRGDILFNNTNSPELVGKSCLFNIDGNEIFLFSNHLTRIRTKKSLDSRYLVYWINALWRRRYFENNCDIWVNQAAVRVEDLLFPIEIPLPPTTDDQIAIANELERRMADIEKIRQAALFQKESITAIQGAILRDAFPYKEGDKLPGGWRWAKIRTEIESDIAVLNKGSYSGENICYIDITSVDNIMKKISGRKEIRINDAPSRAKYILKENDIIVSTVRPNLNSVALIDKTHNGHICSSGFCVLRLKRTHYAPYFFYYLISPYFVETVSKMVQGAMYPAISDDDVKDFKIPLPLDLEGQATIADQLEQKMAEVGKMRRAVNRKVEAVEALPGAFLHDVFGFDKGS